MKKIRFINKSSCFIDKDVIILGKVSIGPNVSIQGKSILGPNTNISHSNISSCEIGSNTQITNSVIENSKIGNDCIIGPFCHIRPSCIVANNCKVGNFVELKNAKLDNGCKVSHLTYIGDATVKENVNVGCGVVFANYDGVNKHKTTIGKNSFIGSNVNLVAPVQVGDNSFIAAGSTITKDIPKNAFCIARSRETIKENRENPYSNKMLSLSTNKYFGTDGIRAVLTDDEYFNLSRKLASAICGENSIKIVIGRDTRESGIHLFNGFLSGLRNAVVYDLGICSTPCTAFMTKQMNADYGIVFTASHNPKNYNGIKVFDCNGQKLNEYAEHNLDLKMQKDETILPSNIKIKKLSSGLYIKHIIRHCEKLDGLKVAIDVAGGGAENLAKKVFRKLGANVYFCGLGANHQINEDCGCLHLNNLKKFMKENDIPIGFAYDGDADRVLGIDEDGKIVDGDNFLYILAKNMKEKNTLKNSCIVTTVMANLALIEKLKKLGINTSLTPVGDKYVIAEMCELDATLGGEQSGHIITRDVCGSGDGLLISALLAGIIKSSNKHLKDLGHIDLFPQLQESFKCNDPDDVLNNPALIDAVKNCEEQLGDGRILLRKSGTEAKVRLLVESKNKTICKKAFDILKCEIEKLI